MGRRGCLQLPCCDHRLHTLSGVAPLRIDNDQK